MFQTSTIVIILFFAPAEKQLSNEKIIIVGNFFDFIYWRLLEILETSLALSDIF